MIKQIENDQFVLDIKQLKKQRLAHSGFLNNNKSRSKIKSYANTTLLFLEWYLQEYCPTIINPTKIYNDKNLAESIFKENRKSTAEFKEFLVKSLFISKEYIEYLITKINNKNICNYEHEISALLIDLEWLIANLEIIHKKSVKELKQTSWRRKELSPTDIYSAARTIFFIEEQNNIKDLYLRDLKPVVIFEIRQLLEVFGRNLLGYYEIIDGDGNTVKKFTQISWEFVALECREPNSRITLPFDIHTILLINKWSNHFVHSTFLYNSYIQFFALRLLKSLFFSDTEGIKIYTGKTIKKYDCADIKIINYESLKNDFENYLKGVGKSSTINVKWMPVDKVGAYILSL